MRAVALFFVFKTLIQLLLVNEKILTKFIKIIDKKTKLVYDETIVSRL